MVTAMRTPRVGAIIIVIHLLAFFLSGCRAPNQAPAHSPEIAETQGSAPATTTPTANPAPSETPAKTEASLPEGKIFFDDFSYSDQQELTANGWIIRAKAGWPGIPGAGWAQENVSLVDDPDQPGNRLLQMTSVTDGTAAGTLQTQICQQRKFLEGTYASRVKFSDEPVVGPDGDQVVETFYMISPLEAPLDPNFSEMDNEYLPNGGWGYAGQTFFNTTWETAQIEPWIADNRSDFIQGSMAGWHTLVMQVTAGDVNYLVDGKLVAQHWGKYYPETPMSINYNLWFINGGLLQSREARSYVEQVDWAYFEADRRLTPPEIKERLAALRGASLSFQDTVPEWEPPVLSPCDL